MRALRLLLVLPCLLLAAPQDAVRQRPNVLLICIDDLRPELRCFGVEYIHSPHIDALAAHGRSFLRHFVQAPTCGASRFTLLTGTYGPAGNDALLKRGDALKGKSLPAWFRGQGYTTVSVGKVSHFPGGRAGADWDDPTRPEMPAAWDRHLMPTGPWQHPRGAMHGLANGEIRKRAEDMAVYQSVAGPDEAYPDGLITNEALSQMADLAKSEAPFFLAVGLIRPHLPFGAPALYMRPYDEARLPPTAHPEKPAGKTTWHGSGEFMKYNRWQRDPNRDAEFALQVRKHYAACVTYADAMVGRLMAQLDRLGLREDTAVVLWGDHGWHLGEHAIWGKHSLFEESLRSPLIISYPGMPRAGSSTEALVETLDVFPTLCELAGIPTPADLDGVSLAPILQDPSAKGHAAHSYKPGAQTIRTETYRLIMHTGGQLELYDHRIDGGETRNLASSQPELAERLSRQLRARLQ